MITFHRKEKREFQTFLLSGKSEIRGIFWARPREKKELLNRRSLGYTENVSQFVKVNFSRQREMEKDSLKQKVIQKKIFCGSHLGHCQSKNSLYSSRCGEIQSSLAGVRGDLSLFRPLSSQRSIFQTLLFLLKLLENGGRVLVVDTGDRSLSLLSWSHGFP